jgi:outer membrane protein
MEWTRLKRFVFGLMVLAPAAHAQYSSSALGVGIQATTVVSTGPQYGLTLEYSRYLESSFEFYVRAPVLIVETPVGAATESGAGRVFGTGLSLGVRYLFHEEVLRPWVGLHLGASVLITRPEIAWFLGPGTAVGLDWVLSESFSLGLRGSYDVFVDLNRPWRHQLGLTLGVAVLF